VPDAASRSPLALAALADAAVYGLEPVAVMRADSAIDDVDAATVVDAHKRRWLVRAPRTPLAAARMNAEARLLTSVAGLLPFSVPDVAGTVALPGGGVAVVHSAVTGSPLHPGQLTPGPGLSAALGRAIAAIHNLPVRVIEDAGMPVYDAADYRHRRLSEVDRAAATGKVPPALLSRWEKALEEIGAWKFMPCPIHGDLAAESVLIESGQVTAVLDWAEARVADPADDIAWVAVGADAGALDAVVEAYAMGRREFSDLCLMRRARLAGELAVARWLLHGVTVNSSEIVDDAVTMLRDLAVSVADSPW
jgi:aminoglycoside phosphotransferase (APT) family kinase protein